MMKDAMTAASMVDLVGVSKVFPLGKDILRPIDNLTFSIEAGKITVLMGRSGCGKSTLLKLVGGLLAPDAGELRYHLDPTEIGIVFQDPRLLPWKSVYENVTLGLLNLSANEQAARAEEALEKVGLLRWAHAMPESLSGGQAQRVAIARALARRPKLLLLDEPFAALDALTRIELQRATFPLLRAQGLSVLLITHDVREGVRLADRLCILSEGHLVEDRTITLTDAERQDATRVAPLESAILERLLTLAH